MKSKYLWEWKWVLGGLVESSKPTSRTTSKAKAWPSKAKSKDLESKAKTKDLEPKAKDIVT